MPDRSDPEPLDPAPPNPEPPDPEPLGHDLLRGNLEGMILASLEAGSLHGYAISERLTERSCGHVVVLTGTLYPALHRLEKAGWLTSEWSRVDGRRRRTYRLTTGGHAELQRRRTSWTQRSRLVSAILGL